MRAVQRKSMVFVFASLWTVLGCGSSNQERDAGPSPDAAPDTSIPAMDAGFDAGADAGIDSGLADAGGDAGALTDAGADASVGSTASALKAPRTLNVTATDFRFSPQTLTAARGESLAIVLRNRGGIAHSIAFELGNRAVARLKGTVAPGRSGRLTFRAPRKAGRYTFFCPVDDHREFGMVGTLKVK